MISVVMPSYNSEQHLRDALSSYFEQSYENTELIFVDGASTDSTLLILGEFSSDRVTIISEPDDGAQDALNKGFALASGDILCWLNADDVYLDNSVLADVAGMWRSDAEFIYGDHCLIDGTGIIKSTLLSWQVGAVGHPLGANIFTGSVFFSSNAWSQFGGFSGESPVAFEYELLDFLFHNFRSRHVKRIFAALRIHEGTLSQRYSGQMLKDIADIRKKSGLPPRLGGLFRRVGMVLSGAVVRKIKLRLTDDRKGRHWSESFSDQGR